MKVPKLRKISESLPILQIPEKVIYSRKKMHFHITNKV